MRVTAVKKLQSKGSSDGSAGQMVLVISAPLVLLDSTIGKVLGQPKNISQASETDNLDLIAISSIAAISPKK